MAGEKGPEVLGVGWCRTGTSSLKVALDILGFGPCFHGRFIPYLPELRKQCYAYGVGKNNNFPVVELFDEYKAAVDIPAGLIPLLLDAYPAAKVGGRNLASPPSVSESTRVPRLTFDIYRQRIVSWYGLISGYKSTDHPYEGGLEHLSFLSVVQVILTVRDPETWYASVQDVIVRLHRWVLRPFFWTTQLGRQYTAIIGWGLDYMFKGDLSKDNCIRAFNAHTEEVRARVPEDRLLIWRPQDGWEPLAKCASLTHISHRGHQKSCACVLPTPQG